MKNVKKKNIYNIYHYTNSGHEPEECTNAVFKTAWTNFRSEFPTPKQGKSSCQYMSTSTNFRGTDLTFVRHHALTTFISVDTWKPLVYSAPIDNE